MKQLGLTAIGAVAVGLVLLIATSSQAITRAEILEGYTTELKKAYNDPSLNPAVTALCQIIARRVHPILPDTSQLDYDLDEKQNEYFEKIGIQLDLDKKTRGLVAWRIFRDACKAEVGYYPEPSRWNGWGRNWVVQETEQEKAEWLQYNHYAKRLKNLCDKEIKIWEEAGSPGGSYSCKNWPLGFDAWLNQLRR